MMLFDSIPDVTVLLSLTPAELAPIVLKLARETEQQGGLIHAQAVIAKVHGPGHDQSGGYPESQRGAAEWAVNEAWHWLKANGLIVPEIGTNGQSGWHRVSRQGASVLRSHRAFEAFRQAAAFPKALLHPFIADDVWLDFARGDLETAVFKAFKMVEVTVREACMFGPADIGVALMRKAFDKDKGPLTNLRQPDAEREALAHLFAGAIGSYKNPHSHRTVTIEDPGEAREMLMLASHLLRIVDSRRP